MKKRLLSLLLILTFALLTSCGAGGNGAETTAAPSPEQTAGGNAETTAPEAEPVQVGIYEMTSYTAGVNEEYTLLEGYTDTLAYGVDICVLSGLPCSTGVVSGATFRDVYEKALASNPDASGLKLGYTVEYNADGGAVSNIIRTPSDIDEGNFKYVEIYIYDDVNRSVGEWYSHLLPEEYNENTVVSSVKLTPGADFAKVSDIKLTAFLYDPAVSGEDGIRGSYTIPVIPDGSR